MFPCLCSSMRFSPTQFTCYTCIKMLACSVHNIIMQLYTHFHQTSLNRNQASSGIHSIKSMCSVFSSVFPPGFSPSLFLKKKAKRVSMIYQLLRNVCIKICFIVNIWYYKYQCTFIPYPECTGRSTTPHALSGWLTSFQPCKNSCSYVGILYKYKFSVRLDNIIQKSCMWGLKVQSLLGSFQGSNSSGQQALQ